MSGDDDRRGRGKLTWRELDKRREQGGGRDRERAPERTSPGALHAQKTYRAALERAFASGKVGELARALATPPEPRQPRVPTPARPDADAPRERAPTPPPMPPSSDAIARGEARRALPEEGRSPLFEADRDARAKLLARIRAAEGKDAVSRAVDAWLAREPRLPDDVEVLTKALAHRDDERVAEVLAQVDALVARDRPRRARALAGQLRLLEETHGDPDVRRLAAAVRGKL